MACKTVTISGGHQRLLEEDYESLMEILEIYQTPGLVDELEQRAGDRRWIKARTHAQVWRRQALTQRQQDV